MVNIIINNISGGPVYIGWSPVECSVSLTAPSTLPTNIILKTVQTPPGGAVRFSNTLKGQPAGTLAVTIPAGAIQIVFFITAIKASISDQDVSVQVVDAASSNTLAQATLMVRIRKNANTLTTDERDRFLSAFVKLNLTAGIPNYKNFLDMHNEAANSEIHTTLEDNPRCSFLPWHRAYVLDMERQLQKFDPSVALPYWKFDEPAPLVFTADFMGADTSTGSLLFSATNPLYNWSVNGKTGVVRKPIFNVQTSAAPVKNEATTLALSKNFLGFRDMENDPHGQAHESFEQSGPITNIFRAPEDPLFFLLHSNVDRLWSLWQAVNNRYNLSDPATYPHAGSFIPGKSIQNIGDYLNDTMWPWNGISGGTGQQMRPPTAPGGQFPQIAVKSTPSPVPVLWENIDYQGYNGGSPSYADYDVIPFAPPKTAIMPENNMEQFRLDRDDAASKNAALAHQFRMSATAPEISLALDNLNFINPADTDLIEKAFALVTDKSEHKNLRLKALKKLTDYLFTSEKAVKDMIDILSDTAEPVEIRRESLQSLLKISFSSPAFNANLPAFKNALRGLLTSPDPELVRGAAEKLAAFKDAGVQNILIEGLKDHTKALVPDAKAIQLLAMDMKSGYYPVVREILAQSNNNEIILESIAALSADPESAPLFLKILLNKKDGLQPRLAALAALNAQDPLILQPTLKLIVADNTEDSELRTAALNALSMHNDLQEVSSDKEFTDAVELLKSSVNEQLQKMSLRFLKSQNK